LQWSVWTIVFLLWEKVLSILLKWAKFMCSKFCQPFQISFSCFSKSPILLIYNSDQCSKGHPKCSGLHSIAIFEHHKWYKLHQFSNASYWKSGGLTVSVMSSSHTTCDAAILLQIYWFWDSLWLS
jgi:hypothetical protein